MGHRNFEETSQWSKFSAMLEQEIWGTKKTLVGWARHNHGVYKTQKENLQSVVTNLDTLAETRLLTNGEREQLEAPHDDLTQLPREEELRYYQRTKASDVLLGDNNTRYFQMIPNGKH